jgi:phosphatidylglycerophosphatase GEP4
MFNLNLSASFNVVKIIFKPGICLPHHTVPNFGELPIPLDKVLRKDGRKAEVKAVVLDKDDCFAYPDSNAVYDEYKVRPSCLFRTGRMDANKEEYRPNLRS